MAERIDIIVSTKGDVTVRKNIDGLDKSFRKAGHGADFLRSAITGMIGAFSVAAIVNTADAATRLTNTLNQTGIAGQELATTQDRIYDAAIKNGQAANQLGNIYQKLHSNQDALGASNEELLGVTEGIAAAMRMSTADASAQAGALGQLSQAFGGATIQAQEYNSLLDGAYPILQTVANGLDETGGSVGKLTQIIKAGGFETAKFFQAFQDGMGETIAKAASMQLTIDQALFGLGQRFQQIIGGVNETTGVFKLWAGAIVFVTDNLETILTVLTPVIAGIVLLAGGAVIGMAITAMANFAIAIGSVVTGLAKMAIFLAVNPIVLVGAAIVGVIAYMTNWGDVINGLKIAFDGLWEAVNKIFGRDGIAPQGNGTITLKVDAADAAAKLESAGKKIGSYAHDPIVKAGKAAGVDMEAGIRKGGAGAASDLEKAIRSNATIMDARDERQKAHDEYMVTTDQDYLNRYAELNGQLVTNMGATFIKGGEVLVNNVTGAIEKVGPVIEDAAAVVGDEVRAGGETAAAAMEKSVAMGGMQAGQSMYQQLAGLGDTWSNSLNAFLGDFIVRAIRLQNAMMQAQVILLRAQAAEIYDKINGSPFAVGRPDRGGSGGSGSGGGGGSGSSTVGNQMSTGFGSDRGGIGDFYFGPEWINGKKAYYEWFDGLRYGNGYLTEKGKKVYGKPADYEGYYNGGAFKVGGSGNGRDQTAVGFMAQQGEEVEIRTRRQQRQQANSNQPPNVTVPVEIRNFLREDDILATMNSPAGRRIILNEVTVNSRHKVRQTVNGR